MPQILHYFFIFSIPWNKELFLGCVKKNYVVRVTWDRFPVDLLYTESDHRIRQNPQKPLWHHQLVWNIFPKHPKKYLKSLLYSVVYYGGWRGELLIIQKVNKLDYIGPPSKNASSIFSDMDFSSTNCFCTTTVFNYTLAYPSGHLRFPMENACIISSRAEILANSLLVSIPSYW